MRRLVLKETHSRRAEFRRGDERCGKTEETPVEPTATELVPTELVKTESKANAGPPTAAAIEANTSADSEAAPAEL